MNVDATKIKVGDKVRLRNGDVLTVTVVNLLDHPTYPVEVCWVGSGYAYTRDGVYWEGDEDDRDIVEITPAETSIDATKIKVGDKIRFRNGDVLTVCDISFNANSVYPVVIHWDEGKQYDGCGWTGYGRFCTHAETDLDIVEIIPAETSEETTQDEMTLRDQFAMAALSALLQGASTKAAEESVAKDAYFFADKMMQARK